MISGLDAGGELLQRQKLSSAVARFEGNNLRDQFFKGSNTVNIQLLELSNLYSGINTAVLHSFAFATFVFCEVWTAINTAFLRLDIVEQHV